MTERLLLVYDGGCGFCRRSVRYLRERDLEDAIQPVPNQTPGIEQRTGLSREQLDHSVWVIDAAGRAYSGARALNRALRALGGPYAALGAVGSLPGPIWLEQGAYEWVSAHRPLVSRFAADPPGRY